MLDSTPWFVGGGAQHSPEVARLLAYASTSGAEGVVEPASLRVSAQSTPNGTVAVRPGAALILNRYAGGGQQTYVLRNATSTSVTIPATGSGGGRTDAIIARVLDPQYEGSAPSDPVTFQYSRLERIGSVPGNLTRVEQLGLSYPAVLLAKVTIPASTGTITNGMITDLREVAIPRRQRLLFAYALTSSDGVQTLYSGDEQGQAFPQDRAEWRVDVPSWATRVNIAAMWGGVKFDPQPGGNWGDAWVRVGALSDSDGFNTQSTRWDTSDRMSGVFREPWHVAASRWVPAGLRGKNIPVYLRAKSVQGAAAGRPQLDAASSISLDIEFVEAAD